MSNDGYPDGRSFVKDFEISKELGDRIHEGIIAGGGYYVNHGKFINVENIPAAPEYFPDVQLVLFEEARAKRHREQKKERRFWQIVHGISRSGKKRMVREFRTPLSDSDRRAFIRARGSDGAIHRAG